MSQIDENVMRPVEACSAGGIDDFGYKYSTDQLILSA